MEQDKYPICGERNSPAAYERFFGRDSGAAPEFWRDFASDFAITGIRRLTRIIRSGLQLRAPGKKR